jgi:hypothetical protein
MRDLSIRSHQIRDLNLAVRELQQILLVQLSE